MACCRVTLGYGLASSTGFTEEDVYHSSVKPGNEARYSLARVRVASIFATNQDVPIEYAEVSSDDVSLVPKLRGRLKRPGNEAVMI